VDTPGLHESRKNFLHTAMNRTARGSMESVDVILLVITAKGWRDQDRKVLDIVRQQKLPVILVINKIDVLKNMTELLPLIEQSAGYADFAAIVPVSARSGRNLEVLEKAIYEQMPESPPGFPAEQVTDKTDRFVAAEMIREQLFRGLGDELPYVTAVDVTRLVKDRPLITIEADIWVEKKSQKAIVVGKSGARIKEIGTRARQALEDYFGQKVFLQLWVKVKEGWSDSGEALRVLGYIEDD
jgi:GTP-binding protein Era